MGEVKELRRKHWSGAEADMASIPSSAIGDTYEATDTGRKYKYDGIRWRGGYEFVPRSDASAFDFVVGDFTTDAVWKVNGLDLSGIVPAGAVAVALSVYLKDDAANSFLVFRQNDTLDLMYFQCKTQVAAIGIDAFAIIPIDSDRKLDYQGSALAFIDINVVVLGWFI